MRDWKRAEFNFWVVFVLVLLAASVAFVVKGCEHEIIAGAEVLRTRRASLVYAKREKEIELISIRVQDGHRGHGYGREVFREMVDRNPEVIAYEALLMHDNYHAYSRAEGTCEERVKRTPMYLIGRRFGFERITWCSEHSTGVMIRVEKWGTVTQTGEWKETRDE